MNLRLALNMEVNEWNVIIRMECNGQWTGYTVEYSLDQNGQNGNGNGECGGTHLGGGNHPE